MADLHGHSRLSESSSLLPSPSSSAPSWAQPPPPSSHSLPPRTSSSSSYLRPPSASRPAATTTSSSIFAGCFSSYTGFFLIALYGITAFLYLSQHSSFYHTEQQNLSRIASLESSLSSMRAVLAATVNRFNRTVTDGEMLDEVKGLRSDVKAQSQHVDAELQTTLDRISNIVSSAKVEIKEQVDEVKSTIEQYKASTADQFAAENNFMLYQLAGMFTLIGFLISLWHVTSHIRNFKNPAVQRKVLAILWMAPIYSLTSWFSLVFVSVEGYLTILRDCYEAYVVYVFLAFLIALLGNGSRDKVVDLLAASSPKHIEPTCLCCCFYAGVVSAAEIRGRSWAMADATLYMCQLLGLQFVLLKPMLAVASFVLKEREKGGSDDTGGYNDLGGDSQQHLITQPLHVDVYQQFSFDIPPSVLNGVRNPELYIVVAQNLSVMAAFYGLLKFYHAIEHNANVQKYKPWPKFLCIKGVVFMTFWQGLAIGLLARTSEGSAAGGGGGSKETVDVWVKQAQSFLICIEMLVASIAHMYVFPCNEWDPDYVPSTGGRTRLMDNLALGDVAGDFKDIVLRRGRGGNAVAGGVGGGIGSGTSSSAASRSSSVDRTEGGKDGRV